MAPFPALVAQAPLAGERHRQKDSFSGELWPGSTSSAITNPFTCSSNSFRGVFHVDSVVPNAASPSPKLTPTARRRSTPLIKAAFSPRALFLAKPKKPKRSRKQSQFIAGLGLMRESPCRVPPFHADGKVYFIESPPRRRAYISDVIETATGVTLARMGAPEVGAGNHLTTFLLCARYAESFFLSPQEHPDTSAYTTQKSLPRQNITRRLI